MQKVLIIVGPTAVGKTKLGIELAQKFDGEIVSGDSMQIYREANIGTAKPDAAELATAKHYLVNEKSVFESYSVKDFVALATNAIAQIDKNNKLPIVVGGTGFYISALINGLQLGEKEDYESPVDSQWEDFLVRAGPESLWARLNELDPAAAEKIPYQNTRRVLRALSVISRTGQLFSGQQDELEPIFDAKIIGLNTEREKLYELINHRIDLMLQAGLLEEAKYLYDNLAEVKQAKQAIGYKELFPYFAGEQTLNEAVDKLKQASRKYAKRQLTYFRNKLNVSWYDLTDNNVARAAAMENLLQEVNEWRKNDN